MRHKRITRAQPVIMIVIAFGLGYLSGSVSQQRADAAQGLGGLLDQAGQMGGRSAR